MVEGPDKSTISKILLFGELHGSGYCSNEWFLDDVLRVSLLIQASISKFLDSVFHVKGKGNKKYSSFSTTQIHIMDQIREY
jgi:hypothetical protein